MSDKKFMSRIVHKHDTEVNWNKATNFIPLQGEIIIYDIDSTYNYERIKIGDGKTLVSALKFVDDSVKVSLGELNTTITNVDNKVNSVSSLVGDTSVSEQINEAISGKVDSTIVTAHINNKSNPHGVTKEQVGLGSVPNVATNNQTPTYSDTTTLATLTSGEKLSVAFAKIKLAITNLINHIANKSNPHEVTKAQVGLDNVGNFKAVSTVASQGLSDTEKTNARNNIGAGTPYTHPNSGVTAGTYRSVTVNATGHITAGTNPTTLSGYGITDAAKSSDLDRVSALIGDDSVSEQITAGTKDFIKALSVSGQTITYTKGDNSTGTITTQDKNTDTKVTNTLNATTKAYITGTTSATTNTGTQIFDTGVYLDTTAGMLTATTFKGALEGNASSATTLKDLTTSVAELNYVDGVTSAIQTQLNDKAPKSHASTGTGYGVGTGSNYGHVKLSDSTTSTSAAASGIAATPKAVNDVYKIANETKNLVGDTSVNTQITNAIKNLVKAEDMDEVLGSVSIDADTLGGKLASDYMLKTDVAALLTNSLPRITGISLLASGWTGSASPYKQTVSISTVTENTKIDLQPSVSQITTMQNVDIALMAENINGTVTVYAFGGKPTANMSMDALLTEVVRV